MRTSQTPLKPKLIGIPEVLLVFGPMVGLLVVSGIYYQSWGWSEKTVALVITGSTFGGLLFWAAVRSLLVRFGLIHPLLIGPDYEAETTSRNRR